MARTTYLAVCLLFLVLTVRVAGFADDSRWGDLHGRFVYDGDPPDGEAIAIARDTDVLGESVPDESLVVNACDRGLANVLVYLLPEDGEELRIHPSYAESANDKLELTMHEGRFEPHVLLMRTTQTMVQVNRDAINHHARIAWFRNDPI
ncbi:MAG: hypothetical protein DWQ34_09265 [Planctomycetota bacterium]|nr:MAG: hypothetical protein DWQ34_09265 [Planctomycetota bacterium]REK20230.1 MAG: hypothetical protein DWQ41_26190 [Planctomycetota bacterium]REK35316.1 MAG: hypothetical protein DWQ45_11330 [Planctomycetota bacterium]